MTPLRALLAALLGLLGAAPAASGHAVLQTTAPERGAVLAAPPPEVTLAFNEGVEAALGGVRVFDARGEQVRTGGLRRPDGTRRSVGVALPAGLGDGVFTATYRVVSADGHPVSGGFVFTVGEPGTTAAALSVDQLVDAGRAGPVTEVAFGAVRMLAYLAMALALGGVALLVAAWLPALRDAGGPEPAWRAAGEAFTGRLRALLLAAVALGVVTSVLGIALQGATATGESLWAALAPSVLGDVLDTRFGAVWAGRAGLWAAVGAVVWVALCGRRAPVLRPAMGAAGSMPAPGPRPALLGAAAVLLAAVALTAGLSGHAGAQEPVWLLLPADGVHVVAMGVWLGGLAALLLAVPAATRRLVPADRTRLLAGAVGRFSAVALVAVAALLVTGVVQALVHVRTPEHLVDTAFGRAVLVKAVLFAGLMALAWANRSRALPALRRAARDGGPPGAGGRALRRALRGEVAVAVVVLGVTSALVSYAPSVAETAGPVSADATLGPARAQLTLDPARVGANELHLYLFDRRTGAQFDGFDELTLTATQRERRIGPIELDAEVAGPGHLVVPQAALGVQGAWSLTLAGRIGEFEEHRAVVEVEVR